MSVWIRNLQMSLEDRPVVTLHVNVRDEYIEKQGRIYTNLTELLDQMTRNLPLTFSELVFYDPVGNERRIVRTPETPDASTAPSSGDSELDASAPANATEPLQQVSAPNQVLNDWKQQLTETDQNRFMTIFYLDKLVAYQNSYQQNDNEILLLLEKVIENITPNNRCVMVALRDTMVPVELYSNSPKTYVLAIPLPDGEDRHAYISQHLKRRLDERLADENAVQRLIDFIEGLTDGLYLRDLDTILNELQECVHLEFKNIREIINKYRIGEQQDYFGRLDIAKLDQADQWFREAEGVKGQDEPIKKVTDMLCLARAGLTGIASGTKSKPKGILFFAGPTGVGKTFVAKKLAKFLFGTEEAFLRFDMSEFKEEHTVSKLIGSPPGYVGYEQGGMLTNAVRGKPFAVILFDEIEKAHPKIMDIFLQVLDEGRLTDSRGQTIFFTETIVIFTSNLGTRETSSRGTPIKERAELEVIVGDEALEDEPKRTAVRRHFVQAVERFFESEISRPELLNRIGNNIVPFNFIHAPEVQKEIVGSHLKRIKEDVEELYRTSGHSIDFEDSVADWMVERYGERISLFGGRAIGDIIEGQALTPLARAMLLAEHEGWTQMHYSIRHAPDGRGLIVDDGG